MVVRRRTRTLLTGLTALLLLGAAPALAMEPSDATDIFTQQDPVAEQLKLKLSAKFSKRELSLRERGALAAFYDEREYKSLWVTNGAFNERALQAMAELSRADVYGLKADDYQLPELASGDSNALAEAELQLSRSLITYIRHANEGRFDQSELSRFLDRKATPIDETAKLNELAAANDVAAFLAGQHPDHPQFKALLKALADESAPKPMIGEAIEIPRGPVLKPGVKHPQVALLRRRLGVAAGENPELFDDALGEAVMAFQKQHDLKPEGSVGAQTRFALNAPQQDMRSKILANIERWRVVPRDLGATHIRVNIPEFTVRVVQNGQIVHEERVIVGKPSNKTPVFSDEMELVEFNPYWNVPESIIWTEMGGRIPIGWEGGVRDGKVWIRQPPGPKNALGKVKFLFPNRHSVYMHDTPTKALFDKQRRAFSHGCMRVRNPDRLAEVVLGMQGWTPDKVRRGLISSQHQSVPLNMKIPVHVTYFSLWADDAGNLQSFEDVYGHDNRIYAAIDKGVDYAKARFPEVQQERIEALPYVVGEESSSNYSNWWFPSSTGGNYWNNNAYQNQGAGSRTRLYQKKKVGKPIDNFFDLF